MDPFTSRFESREQMHALGYRIESELPKVEIKPLWIDEIKRLDISISQLSIITGIHRQSLYAAASGKNLSLESALRISVALGLPLEQLFSVDPDSLYSPFFTIEKLFVVHPETLEVLPRRSKEYVEMPSEEHDKYELLYKKITKI